MSLLWKRLPIAVKSMTIGCSVMGTFVAIEKYQNYKDDIAEAENRLENHQRDRVRIGEAKLRTALADSQTKCYMDLEMEGQSLGRLTFALYDSIVPDTVQNFAALCNNQCSTIYAESKGKQDMNLKFGYAKNKVQIANAILRHAPTIRQLKSQVHLDSLLEISR